jgi:shikimate dehydrogenase
MTDRLVFIGVTTAQSSIMRLFPAWMERLGLDAVVVGRDLPLDGEPAAYRRAVEEIRDDPASAGALVTTHKVAVHQHAGDLFDELDRWARLCGEISCISKRQGRLIGKAMDPITSGLALEAIVGPTYWRDHPDAEVLCMGSGGSGLALAVHLLSRADRPSRIIMTSRRQDRLESVRSVARRLGDSGIVDCRAVASEADTDALLATLATGSLVVNATGAGKDRPGSPISDAAIFPEGAIAWDFNYRGDLRFLGQARRQLPSTNVHDGWRYFIHGWTDVIAEVFGIGMTPERLAALEAVAERSRQQGAGDAAAWLDPR